MHFRSPKDATNAGIATVYQDLALADNLDIVQNMMLGHEVLKDRAARRDHHGEDGQEDPG